MSASKWEWRDCLECGERMRYVPGSGKKQRCVPCGTLAMIEYNTQLANKSGPAYDAWLISMKKKFQ